MITNHTFHVICIGKNKDAFIQQGIEQYSKNITKFCNIKWHYLKESKNKSIKHKIEEEAQTIKNTLSSIKATYIICLDEKPKTYTSKTLSEKTNNLMNSNTNITFITGGAYGLAKSIQLHANEILSLSALTFNHLLVRLVLAEQIYRSLSLIYNTGYHH